MQYQSGNFEREHSQPPLEGDSLIPIQDPIVQALSTGKLQLAVRFEATAHIPDPEVPFGIRPQKIFTLAEAVEHLAQNPFEMKSNEAAELLPSLIQNYIEQLIALKEEFGESPVLESLTKADLEALEHFYAYQHVATAEWVRRSLRSLPPENRVVSDEFISTFVDGYRYIAAIFRPAEIALETLKNEGEEWNSEGDSDPERWKKSDDEREIDALISIFQDSFLGNLALETGATLAAIPGTGSGYFLRDLFDEALSAGSKRESTRFFQAMCDRQERPDPSVDFREILHEHFKHGTSTSLSALDALTFCLDDEKIRGTLLDFCALNLVQCRDVLDSLLLTIPTKEIPQSLRAAIGYYSESTDEELSDLGVQTDFDGFRERLSRINSFLSLRDQGDFPIILKRDGREVRLLHTVGHSNQANTMFGSATMSGAAGFSRFDGLTLVLVDEGTDVLRGVVCFEEPESEVLEIDALRLPRGKSEEDSLRLLLEGALQYAELLGKSGVLWKPNLRDLVLAGVRKDFCGLPLENFHSKDH